MFILFHAEEGVDEFEAEVLGKAEDEDEVFAGLLDLAVGGVEEEVVAAAAADGVGTEVAGAVVVGLHAPFLAGAVAVRHEVGVILEGAGVDVDVAVLVEDRLGLDADIVDENSLSFHCCEFW